MFLAYCVPMRKGFKLDICWIWSCSLSTATLTDIVCTLVYCLCYSYLGPALWEVLQGLERQTALPDPYAYYISSLLLANGLKLRQISGDIMIVLLTWVKWNKNLMYRFLIAVIGPTYVLSPQQIKTLVDGFTTPKIENYLWGVGGNYASPKRLFSATCHLPLIQWTMWSCKRRHFGSFKCSKRNQRVYYYFSKTLPQCKEFFILRVHMFEVESILYYAQTRT